MPVIIVWVVSRQEDVMIKVSVVLVQQDPLAVERVEGHCSSNSQPTPLYALADVVCLDSCEGFDHKLFVAVLEHASLGLDEELSINSLGITPVELDSVEVWTVLEVVDQLDFVVLRVSLHDLSSMDGGVIKENGEFTHPGYHRLSHVSQEFSKHDRGKRFGLMFSVEQGGVFLIKIPNSRVYRDIRSRSVTVGDRKWLSSWSPDSLVEVLVVELTSIDLENRNSFVKALLELILNNVDLSLLIVKIPRQLRTEVTNHLLLCDLQVSINPTDPVSIEVNLEGVAELLSSLSKCHVSVVGKVEVVLDEADDVLVDAHVLVQTTCTPSEGFYCVWVPNAPVCHCTPHLFDCVNWSGKVFAQICK
jgi:hypothetical protein